MLISERHNFEVGRWVRLLKGPHAGQRGQIVGRRGNELELLVNRGPEWPITVSIEEVQKALVDTRSHDRAMDASSDSRRGSD